MGTCRNRAWAGWPMPNPVSTGLPNPANYDTSTAGVVVDRVTGLEWQADGTIGSMMTQSEAVAFCQGLSLNGHTDWRLPSVIELVSIVDRTRFNPSINVSAFPITPLGEYWTSSAHLGFLDRGWYVGFDSGIVWTTPSSTPSYARCVR